MVRKGILAILLIALTQAANYLVPFILFPVYKQHFGMEVFGMIAFMMSVAMMLQIIVDFGFNITATRDIAILLRNGEAIDGLFRGVQSCRIYLAFLTFPLYIAIAIWVGKDEKIYAPLGALYLIIISNALTPSWFFYGAQKYLALSFIICIPRALIIFVTLVSVRSYTDISMAMLILGVGNLISASASILYVRYSDGISSFPLVNLKNIIGLLRENLSVLASSTASSFYALGIVVVIQIVCGPVAVAVYSASERLVKSAQFVVAPVAQYFYPRSSVLIRDSGVNTKFHRNVLFIFLCVGVLLSVLMLLVSRKALEFMYGDMFKDYAYVNILMSFFPIIFSISLYYSQIILLAAGKSGEVMRCYVGGGIFFAVTSPLMSYVFDLQGAIVSLLATEVFVIVVLYRNVISVRVNFHKDVP